MPRILENGSLRIRNDQLMIKAKGRKTLQGKNFNRKGRAVSGYFGNGARAFEIGKNSVVLDKIGKNFNKLKKISIIICNQGCICIPICTLINDNNTLLLL